MLDYLKLDLLKEELEEAKEEYDNFINESKDQYEDYLFDVEDEDQVSFEEYIIDDMNTPQQLQELIEEAQSKVDEFLKLVSQVEELYNSLNPNDVTTSKSSVSTYFKFDLERFDEIAEIANVVKTKEELMSEEETTFTLRISDHSVGNFRNKYTGELESYSDSDVQIVIG